jgi:uncharacterized protein YdhG (YjbR/CyaY superfamily)
MATKDPSRESHFPAIEKKYGEKMSYWFKVMAALEGQKYPEQIAHLCENYGFSQAHANALVMYSRGSLSAHRHETPAQYFKSIDPTQARTIKKIIKVIKDKYPDLEFVISYNQPMLRKGTIYVFGASVSKNHISIAPWSTDVIDKFRPKLTDYRVTKKMIAVPNDWEVDIKLLHAMIKARLAES